MALTLTVRPRLQRETWSLYWRETMATETSCAADVALPMIGDGGGGGGGGGADAGPASAAAGANAAAPPPPKPLPATATVRDALRAAAEACGWPPVASLVRLEGFEASFERCLVRGVEVGLDEPAAKFAASAAAAAAAAGDEGAASAAAAAKDGAAAGAPPPLVYVRTVLAAEGWRLANDPNDPAGYSTSDDSDTDGSDDGGKA